ncbi:MAG: M28 family peptidase [Sulfolobales archaeon]
MAKLLSELASVKDVIAGSEEELFVVNKLRSYLEEMGIHSNLNPVDVLSWRDLECEVSGFHCICLPPIRSYEVHGLLTNDLSNCGGKVLITSTTNFPDNVWVLYNLAVETGAEAVVFYDEYPGRYRRIVVTGVWSYSLGRGDYPPIPAVHMRYEDGIKLMKLVGSYVDLRCRTEVRLGTGYNVEAFIGGRRESEVLVSAHHDRWLTGFRDNLVGTYTLMKIAERATRSNLKHTLRLVSFTAEEFGNPTLSPWYWSYGSREYARKSDLSNVEFVVNLDTACKEPVRINATGPEIGKYFVKYSPINYVYEGFDHAYTDGLTFSSMGIPTVTLQNLRDIDEVYHTDLDTWYDAELITDSLADWIINSINDFELEKLEFQEYRRVLENSLGEEFKWFIDKVKGVVSVDKLSRIFREVSKELVKPVLIGSYKDLNKDLTTLLAPHAFVINNLRKGIRTEDVVLVLDNEVLRCPAGGCDEVIEKYTNYVNSILHRIISHLGC